MKAPCKNCEQRHESCHSDCDKYKAYRDGIKERQEEEKKQKEVDRFASDRKRRTEKYKQRIAGRTTLFNKK